MVTWNTRFCLFCLPPTQTRQACCFWSIILFLKQLSAFFFLLPVTPFFCVTCLSWNREYSYPSWVSKVENSVVLSYSPTAAHWLEQSIEGWKEKEETGVRLSMCRQGAIVGLTAEQTIVDDSQIHSTLLLCSSEECVGWIWKRTLVSWRGCKNKNKNTDFLQFMFFTLYFSFFF